MLPRPLLPPAGRLAVLQARPHCGATESRAAKHAGSSRAAGFPGGHVGCGGLLVPSGYVECGDLLFCSGHVGRGYPLLPGGHVGCGVIQLSQPWW